MFPPPKKIHLEEPGSRRPPQERQRQGRPWGEAPGHPQVLHPGEPVQQGGERPRPQDPAQERQGRGQGVALGAHDGVAYFFGRGRGVKIWCR